jgi:hypothetical protein
LAIHGKRVELSQLGNLARTWLKKAKGLLNSKVKMGLSGIKSWDWTSWKPEDNLSNIRYVFESSY